MNYKGLIHTTKGEEILVSEEDYPLLSRHSWDINNSGYARTSINNNHVLMHKLIQPSGKGMVTDHINRNKLDNRRENLRVISRAENNYNHGHKTGDSGYMGVYKHSNGKHYFASISFNDKTIYLGKGNNVEETAMLRDYAVWITRGTIGVYNFPDVDYSKFEHPRKTFIENKLGGL